VRRQRPITAQRRDQVEHGNRNRLITLLILAIPAFAYLIIIQQRAALTGQNRFDGIIGAMLGLYMCSLAAADMIDMLFTHLQKWSGLTGFQWLALNMAFLLLGLIVIITGTTRFTTVSVPTIRP
jgi:hypothetical protein